VNTWKKRADFETAPAPEDVRAELERVLESEPFRPSAQLRVFLRYIVETTLTGEADRIRAFTIAVEAFGREKDFDPQGDPIVRVEAARLRRALDQYYSGPGSDDAVEIAVPRGAYVPQFRYRARARGAAHRAAPVALRAPRSRIRLYGAAAALLLVCAAVAGVTVLRQQGDSSDITSQLPLDSAERPKAALARSRSPLPVVLVEPITAVADAPFTQEFGVIRAKLADSLARFDDIEVIAEPPAPPAAVREPRASSVYRLTIAGERHSDGAVSPRVQLIDAGNGAVVWAHGFERLRAGDDFAATAEAIARQVAPTLAQPFGVIYARELAAPSGDSKYRCLLDAIEYRRTLDPSHHVEIRACLERTLALDPKFPSVQAALAFLTLREYYAGENRDPKVLDDALRLALRAVEIKPGSARAHHVLMNVLFARGDLASAMAEGERAIALNPYDMTAFIGYGLRLAFADRAAEGLVMLERAAALSPVRPPILEFALFAVHHALGNDARAAHHAALLTDEIHPFVLLARALVAIKAGERERAQQHVDRLFTLHPAWRISPRREIERYIPAANVVDHMMRDLAPVGFGTTN
jgi:tetratricopeptide (TPR) repeat protein